MVIIIALILLFVRRRRNSANAAGKSKVPAPPSRGAQRPANHVGQYMVPVSNMFLPDYEEPDAISPNRVYELPMHTGKTAPPAYATAAAVSVARTKTALYDVGDGGDGQAIYDNAVEEDVQGFGVPLYDRASQQQPPQKQTQGAPLYDVASQQQQQNTAPLYDIATTVTPQQQHEQLRGFDVPLYDVASQQQQTQRRAGALAVDVTYDNPTAKSLANVGNDEDEEEKDGAKARANAPTYDMASPMPAHYAENPRHRALHPSYDVATSETDGGGDDDLYATAADVAHSDKNTHQQAAATDKNTDPDGGYLITFPSSSQTPSRQQRPPTLPTSTTYDNIGDDGEALYSAPTL
ncbi:hypothetical protein PTSG_13003 [Salpingoeca rosetta]|uniref:Uncharacterized protein n=1 Tax=Salpingoeca rosetta (strain ATCC 50818 / BSB-021) TaxID=946362 RepID=F2UQE5_SALR5|nr:uncharacterized protein PTSG_13003 [Salpingoeca rosetta]EGD79850.1 hypothetical protein PTSG_13003 [Salpingoeca rosetta]|eukprot:XP_004988471.1 hypothetical protein PTSG_13003 [Salpingoeca rosetta]